MKKKNFANGMVRLSVARLVLSCVVALAAAGCDAGGGGGSSFWLWLFGGGSDTPSTYSVIYDGNGNTGGTAPADPQEYEKGAIVTVPGNTGNLVKTGFTFAGWNTGADGGGTTYSQGQVFTMGEADVRLYAKWTAQATFAVTYDGNGNTGGEAPVDSTRYLPGQTVTVLSPGTIVKIGYTFNGWNTDVNGSGTSYVAGQTFPMESDNVTLWAQWTELPTCTVTYNGNDNTGGAVPADGTFYLQGQPVIVLGNTGNLSKTGYTFAGWNTDEDGNGVSYAAGETFYMGTEDVILWAQWTAEATYSVTYNGNGSTGGAVPVDPAHYLPGQTVTVQGPGTLLRSGYAFAGWNTAANGGGTTYAQGQTFTMGTAEVVLYAQWTAVAMFTVTYNGNGSTGGAVPVDPAQYLPGQTVTVLGAGTLVRSGYTFSGWNSAAGGGGTPYAAGAVFTMGSGNVTLYAQWVQNNGNFTEVKKGFDAAGVQVSQRETVFTSQAAYAATYNPRQQFGYLQNIISSGEGASSIQPPYIVTMKISNGAGANGIWMDSDDVDVSYVLNRFDENDVIYETNVYRDFFGVRRLEYTRYTLNSDGTYHKILFYTNSGVLTGSVYFTNVSGLMKQLDYWSGDGSGTQNQQIILTYDASLRLITVLQLMNDCSGDECSGLENLQKDAYEYSGSNVQASKRKLSMWVVGLMGGYWYSMGSLDYTLNGSGTLVLTSTGSLMSVGSSSLYTYTGADYYDRITSYSDEDWGTMSGYFEFGYY